MTTLEACNRLALSEGQKENKYGKESEKMKWTWFNKERLGVGFVLGILFILLGLWAVNEYVNVAAGQRGAEILVFIATVAMFAGVTNNVYIAICWLRRSKTGRHIDTRD